MGSCDTCVTNPKSFIASYTLPMKSLNYLPLNTNIPELGTVDQILRIIFLLICFVLFLDALLHHIWEHRNVDKFKDFQEFYETIQLTPRAWNLKSNFIHMLKYITWTLNININLIGFRRTKNMQSCSHNNTYFLFYKFQNSIVKLLRHPHPFTPLNIVYYSHKYFLLADSQWHPFLINVHPQDSIAFNSVTILPYHITQIIANESLQLPFSINIYTSYSYIHASSIKRIQTNLIGNYVFKNNSDVLHVFVSPNLCGTELKMSHLSHFTTSIHYHRSNVLANCHSTEGNPIISKQVKNQEILNQTFCVCDHTDTQRIFSPNSFKHLGKEITFINKFCHVIIFSFF